MADQAAGPGKNRHGCLTAYLIFMIVANSATVLFYLFSADSIRQRLPDMPNWAFPVLSAIGIINLICAIALFRWKKWGFWGFILTSVIVFGINLTIGVNIISAILGLAGVAILFGVLHIGTENKGWPQLD